MFESAMQVDEFRTLLKRQVGYVEASEDSAASLDEEALAATARLLSSDPLLVREWVAGTGRPTPFQEMGMLTMLRGLNNFAPQS